MLRRQARPPYVGLLSVPRLATCVTAPGPAWWLRTWCRRGALYPGGRRGAGRGHHGGGCPAAARLRRQADAHGHDVSGWEGIGPTTAVQTPATCSSAAARLRNALRTRTCLHARFVHAQRPHWLSALCAAQGATCPPYALWRCWGPPWSWSCHASWLQTPPRALGHLYCWHPRRQPLH